MENTGRKIRRSTLVLILVLAASLVLSGILLVLTLRQNTELQSMKKQLQWERGIFLSEAYLYMNGGAVICDYLFDAPLAMKPDIVLINNDELAAMLESPTAEVFESDGYQGIRVRLIPKPNEEPAEVMKILSASPSDLVIFWNEEDGHASGFATVVFKSDPPYNTTS